MFTGRGERGGPTDDNTSNARMPPSLSLAASDLATGLRSPGGGDSAPICIRRMCDIDSIFMGTPSLGAFRIGITLHFYPLYMQRIRQSQVITIGGKNVAHYKHMRLATGLLCAGLGLYTYIVFPCAKVERKPITAHNHLNDRQLAAWHDYILLPALRRVLTGDQLARMPPSSEIGRMEAASLKEWHPGTRTQRMNLSETLTQDVAAQLWDVIKQRVRHFPGTTDVPATFFQGAFLVTAGHNLKLLFRKPTIIGAYNECMSTLQNILDIERYPLPRKDFWVDIAWEDIPSTVSTDTRGTDRERADQGHHYRQKAAGKVKPRSTGITLLWKTEAAHRFARCLSTPLPSTPSGEDVLPDQVRGRGISEEGDGSDTSEWVPRAGSDDGIEGDEQDKGREKRGDDGSGDGEEGSDDNLEEWLGEEESEEEDNDRDEGSTHYYGARKILYPWSLTRDASSVEVVVNRKSPIWRSMGIAHGKAYMVHKETTATPHKGMTPFSTTRMEALAYTEDMVERWYKHKSRGGIFTATGPALASFLACKRRIASKLLATTGQDYPARTELRVRVDSMNIICSENGPQWARAEVPPVYLGLTDDGEGSMKPFGGGVDSSPAKQADQLPYWVLRTDEVNMFIGASIDRFLCCAEGLISMALATQQHRSSYPHRSAMKKVEMSVGLQLAHGSMLSAMLRLSAATLGSHPGSRKWRSVMVDRMGRGYERKHDRHASSVHGQNEGSRLWSSDDDDDEEDEDNEHSGVTGKAGRRRRRLRLRGLGVNRLVETTGFAWLRPELMDFSPYPHFYIDALSRLELAQSDFQSSFHAKGNIGELLLREDQFIQALRRRLLGARTASQWVQLFSQAVVRQYVLDVIAILRGRWDASATGLARRDNGQSRRGSSRAPIDRLAAQAHDRSSFGEDVTQAELDGLAGLQYEMVFRLIGGCVKEPLLSSVRPGRRRWGGADPSPQKSLSWRGKLTELFQLQRSHDGSQPLWDNSAFRRLLRTLYRIVEVEIGVDAADTWANEDLISYAQRYLWCIPRYDREKLSLLAKVKPEGARGQQSQLGRTQWLMPALMPPPLYRKLDDPKEKFVDWGLCYAIIAGNKAGRIRPGQKWLEGKYRGLTNYISIHPRDRRLLARFLLRYIDRPEILGTWGIDTPVNEYYDGVIAQPLVVAAEIAGITCSMDSLGELLATLVDEN